jgi:hypothetical protein
MSFLKISIMMTEKKAMKILIPENGECERIMTKDEYKRSPGKYAHWKYEPVGFHSPQQLRAIAWWMENKQ